MVRIFPEIYVTHFSQASVSNMISNLFVSVVLILSCAILDKYNLIENVYIVLSYLIK